MTEGATGIFGSTRERADTDDFERQRDELHAKIGQLTVEVDFLRKKSKQLGLWGIASSWSKKKSSQSEHEKTM